VKVDQYEAPDDLRIQVCPKPTEIWPVARRDSHYLRGEHVSAKLLAITQRNVVGGKMELHHRPQLRGCAAVTNAQSRHRTPARCRVASILRASREHVVSLSLTGDYLWDGEHLQQNVGTDSKSMLPPLCGRFSNSQGISSHPASSLQCGLNLRFFIASNRHAARQSTSQFNPEIFRNLSAGCFRV
jgi:hypothetical protein